MKPEEPLPDPTQPETGIREALAAPSAELEASTLEDLAALWEVDDTADLEGSPAWVIKGLLAQRDELKETVERQSNERLFKLLRDEQLAEALRDHARLGAHNSYLVATVERLRGLTGEMLSQFTEKSHPGRPCLRTPHVHVETVDRWRAALAEGDEKPKPKCIDWEPAPPGMGSQCLNCGGERRDHPSDDEIDALERATARWVKGLHDAATQFAIESDRPHGPTPCRSCEVSAEAILNAAGFRRPAGGDEKEGTDGE